jgi:proline iminopeptidase
MIWSTNMYRRLAYADRLGSVSAPTLVLVGRHDPEAPLPASGQLFRGIPDARLVILEDSGHYPFVEEASHFADAVDAFLNLDRV